MSFIRGASSGAVLALAALGLGGEAALACSVCLAGDPIFSSQGTTAQQVGNVSIYLELRGWEKDSGLLPHAEEPDEHVAEEEPEEPGADEDHDHGDAHAGHAGEEHNRSRRLDLYAAWTPVDRLTLTLGVPWAVNGIEEVEEGERTHLSLDGLGDVSLAASAVAWRDRPVLPSTWIEGRVWGKAPSGRDETRVDGVQDPHLQPGTGSWDFGVGAAATHRTAWGAFYASAFYRVNTEGGLDYEYGDVALATAALEVPLGHALGREELARLTPGLALDFRWAAHDEQDGESWKDSGGSILYATPSLRVQLPAFDERQRAWLRAGVQVPLTSAWLHGDQHEDPVWSLGLGYGF